MPTPTIVPASYSEVQAFAKAYHDEIFYEPTALSPEQLFAGLDGEKTAGLQASSAARRYGFFIKLEGEIVGWHLARQSGLLFCMEGSGLRPHHQGKGYYKQLLETVVALAREEGYAAVVSTHAADNNRILLPKLRFGFVIKGFEINPMYGLDVKLIYYFSEGQKRAHALRVGSRASLSD